MIILALYNAVDTFWVARLGHEAIAALTIVLPYHILNIAIGVGTGVGIIALTSRRFGEGNIEATNYVAGQIFPITAFFGSIFLVAAVFFSRPILTAFGATPDIMDYATQYLVIIGYGAPFLILSITINNLLRGSGDALRPMMFMLIGTVINIILDPFMIFGIGPFPEMGVRGAALATVISLAVSSGVSFYYIVARKSAYRIKMRYLKPRLSVLLDIYRVGFPTMITIAMESVMFALINSALSAFGSLAIAAAGIAIRVIDLALMPVFGLSNGLLPIVGFNFGARLWHRLWRAVRLASGGIVLLIGTATVAMEIFTPQLIGIFSKDPELLAIAVPAMRILLSSPVIIGPTIMFITVFQGLSKGNDAMILSLSRQLVFFVPLLFLLPRILGIYGVWLSLPVSDVLAFFVSGLWLLREYRRQRRTGVWSDLPAT